MAPIEPSIGNAPSIGNPPSIIQVAPRPSDTVSWRSMAVNWAGSMVFIGFCAPLLVWLTVYCIRTRKKRDKVKGKLGTIGTAIQESVQQPSVNDNATPPPTRCFRHSQGRSDLVETYNVNPLNSGPAARDHNNNKIPKTTHLSRYLGWWSSGTSREETYPPDPRARKKGARPLSKREHLTRFFGWCTSSAHERNEEHRRHSDPGPATLARDERRSLGTFTSHEVGEGIDDSNMQLSTTLSQRWRSLRHLKAHTSLETLDEFRGSQAFRPTKKVQAGQMSSQDLHTNATGADIRHREGSGQSRLRSSAEGGSIMEGISDNQTVRRRPRGVTEACEWASLSKELRRSVHTQALLPDEGGETGPTVKPFEHTEMTPTHALLPAMRVTSSPKLLNECMLPVSAPKLRKVYSSPALHATYMDLDASSKRLPSCTTQTPSLPSHNPEPLVSRQYHVDGWAVEKAGDLLQHSARTGGTTASAESNTSEVRYISQSSRHFSFDKTKKSTLDIHRILSDADRQTLDDYEAEGSVYVDFSSRAGSGTTFASFEKETLHMKRENEVSLRALNSVTHDQKRGNVNNASRLSDHSHSYRFRDTLMKSSRRNRALTTGIVDSEYPARMANLVAVSTGIQRPCSCPTPQEGMDVRQGKDRKSASLASRNRQPEIDRIFDKKQTLPRYMQKIPPFELAGGRDLVVSKKRAARMAKGNGKEIITPRKLTPWSNASSSRSSPRKSLPRNWQTLDRLSENTSMHSENEAPITSCRSTVCVYSQSTSSCSEDGSRGARHPRDHDEISGCKTYAGSTSATPIRVMPNRNAQRTSASMFTDVQDSTKFLPTPSNLSSEIHESTVKVFAEIQLSSEESLVQQAFEKPSSAEETKTWETLQRAGRGTSDSEDIVTRNMPKKRSLVYSKPSSPAHPSLSSSSKNTASSATSPNSVNERIQQLRLEQTATGSKPFEAPPPHTVHPSLQAILQVPDVPPPRPRPGLRVTGGRRGPAGPAPPSSWLKRRPTEQRRANSVARPKHGTSSPLPGYDMPRPGSLSDLTLKQLATEWAFHSQYDQYYLATIPVRHKELLLRYIAVHSPHGIDRAGLETLFLDETELEDATGAEDLLRLDCSSSIGRSLPLKDLKPFFTTPPPPPPPPSSSSTAPEPPTTTTTPTPPIPETWDTPPPGPPIPPPLFSTLTHLSLSHPPPTISWSHLLHTPLPPTLTHLSLAFWPPPTLTPNALTAFTTTPHTGAIQAGGTSLYSAYDGDWSEATSILRRVAKMTAGVRWLGLEGCWPWMRALEGVDWSGSPGGGGGGLWGGLEVVVVGQGWVPRCLLVERVEEAQEGRRGWREVYGFVGGAGGWGERERRELVEWVRVEVEGWEFERVVRGRVGDAMANGVRAEGVVDYLDGDGGTLVNDDDVVDEDDDDDWTATWQQSLTSRRRRSTRTRGTARKHGIRFERGWDAPWIRDAVIEIDERERRLRSTR